MKWYSWLILAFVVFILIKGGKSMYEKLKSVLMKWEGFSPVPYWDNKQWSWGYGSEVPDSIPNPSIKPTGTITKEQAINHTLQIAAQDKAYLQKYLKRTLSNNEWTALLSFAYNEGTGAALKLVPEINTRATSLENHWKQYVYAAGVVNKDLVARRNYEWSIYSS